MRLPCARLCVAGFSPLHRVQEEEFARGSASSPSDVTELQVQMLVAKLSMVEAQLAAETQAKEVRRVVRGVRGVRRQQHKKRILLVLKETNATQSSKADTVRHVPAAGVL